MENEVYLKVKPKTNIGYYFLWNTWMLIVAVIIIILTFIFGAVAINTLEEMSPLTNGLMSAIRMCAITVVPVVYIYQTVKMYLHTIKISYTFYEDFVRYEDNFLNKESKDIKYENITEVAMFQNIWARLLKVGNIHIKTNVEYNVGVYMPFVERPQETVDEIRKIISEADDE